MSNKPFQASLSRSKGRSSWCLLFRHPMRMAKDGKSGLRVRRGLGTENDIEAQTLVNQLNEILSDISMWNLGARSRAEVQYDARVVAAFYDYLAPELHDPWEVRNGVIPLPSIEEGYARALLVGTTGAGKTTLLRHLIGTDPKTERFPSTSTAKTTTSNIEIILGSSPLYSAVVTFFTQPYVRQHVEESIMAAALAWIDTKSEKEVERKFLEHSEQRFRLSYLLGTLEIMKHVSSARPSTQSTGLDLDFLDEEFERKIEEEEVNPDIDLTTQEREFLLIKLNTYLKLIRTLAENVYNKITSQLDIDIIKVSDEDKIILYELLEEQIENETGYHEFIDDVMDDIQDRFRSLQREEIIFGKDGWPLYLTFNTHERPEFIKKVNRFSSNYAPNFGSLLTPLVEGLRVGGPFIPTFYKGSDLRLVLMDGEGLGHTPDSAISVSTSVTKRYKSADAILLVDNATQPMQATPTSVLRNLVATGHHAKLIVVFSHFDAVSGDNFLNNKMKATHVLNSYENAVAYVGKALGERAGRSLESVKNGRIFFLSNLDKPKESLTTPNVKQFESLVEAIHKLAQPEVPTEAVPLYDDANLILGIRDATEEFHNFWRARLNLESPMKIRAEHWTRVKALTRRLGELGVDEYDSLKPIADLQRFLGEEIYRFLENPLNWQPSNASDEIKIQAIAKITREVDTKLYDFVSDKIFLSQTRSWYQSYLLRGPGSTKRRAIAIRNIYDLSAPIPNKIVTQESRDFLHTLRSLVQESITIGGGQTIQARQSS